MAQNEVPAQKSGYKTGIDNTVGSQLVTSPCVLYDISFANTTGSSIVVTVHDSTGTSATATRKIKATVAANANYSFHFPKGKKFDTAMFVKANTSGLDAFWDID